MLVDALVNVARRVTPDRDGTGLSMFGAPLSAHVWSLVCCGAEGEPRREADDEEEDGGRG